MLPDPCPPRPMQPITTRLLGAGLPVAPQRRRRNDVEQADTGSHARRALQKPAPIYSFILRHCCLSSSRRVAVFKTQQISAVFH